VTAVELNPAYAIDVVVHEIYGHPEYGKAAVARWAVGG
jgi:hypothetical protein